MVQNALIGNEIGGKYALQRFKSGTDLKANRYDQCLKFEKGLKTCF
jgi:hypothetical protein